MQKSALNSSEDFKKDVISMIMDNEDAQFHWTLMFQCIKKEKEAAWLLLEISNPLAVIARMGGPKIDLVRLNKAKGII